jgi:colicin import membrane protein
MNTNITKVRLINVEQTRKLFEQREALSISELSQELGFSDVYVDEIVMSLEHEGLIREGERKVLELGYGRPVQTYELNANFCLTLGVMLESGKGHSDYETALHYQLIDMLGEELERGVEDCGKEFRIESLYRLVRVLKQRCPTLKRVVVGLSGVISNGVIEEVYDSAFGSLVGLDLKKGLEERFKVRCEVARVMNLAALGYYDAYKEAVGKGLAYIGQEAGGRKAGGYVVNGVVVEGVNGFAGFIGCAGKEVSQEERKKCAVRLVENFVTMLNPAEIVFAVEAFKDEAFLRGVEEACAADLSAKWRPKLVARDDWAFDAWRGIFVLAKGIYCPCKAEEDALRKYKEREKLVQESKDELYKSWLRRENRRKEKLEERKMSEEALAARAAKRREARKKRQEAKKKRAAELKEKRRIAFEQEKARREALRKEIMAQRAERRAERRAAKKAEALARKKACKERREAKKAEALARKKARKERREARLKEAAERTARYKKRLAEWAKARAAKEAARQKVLAKRKAAREARKAARIAAYRKGVEARKAERAKRKAAKIAAYRKGVEARKVERAKRKAAKIAAYRKGVEARKAERAKRKSAKMAR